MKKLLLLCLTAFAVSACSSGKYGDLGDGLYADIQTNKGDMIVKLFYDKTPVTVANFVSLAEGTNPFVKEEYKDKKYYEGVTFHRVIDSFMIQAGDPTGTGRGGPGYRFKDEFAEDLRHDKKGILSMANAGFGTNGSQFFITHAATPFLDAYDAEGNPKPCEFRNVSCHSVFGEVVEGMEVVDTIATVETSQDRMNKDRPKEDVVINNIQIVRKGKEAKNFDAVQVMTDYFEEEESKGKAVEEAKAEIAATFKEQKEKAERTPSGLGYLVMEEGNGNKPSLGQTVMVNYAGFYENGELFDTSWKEVAEKFGKLDQQRMSQGMYRPVPMRIHPDMTLIPGFKEGLNMMEEGEKLRLFIPSHLGYGEAGYGPIPPNTDLVFDLKIVEIQQNQGQ
ncbi:peptidylprolyl isomerase [Robertkochia aurantiaca]|uniref:peptidylprolyl isomerase n=1 Tax=Robertkochia aurantiaca TaxID=2873700 RepID=UPI001CCC5454|nr:peptidylprolyl isomerase [Robertkochia sp. 3YJGBD-33]